MPHTNIRWTVNTCPHCRALLNPPPKRSKKCPVCGDMIYVRTAWDKSKMLMTRADALYYRGVPVLDELPVHGSCHTELCVCHSCGEKTGYRLRFGIDHFPLECNRCGKQTVYLLFNDEMSDLDWERLRDWAASIGKPERHEEGGI